MSDSTFGFIGLGLIGGSIARGLRRANKDITIMAYMRTRSKLEQAKKEGTIDIILDGIDETLSACDIIFLCTPVEYNAMYLEKVRPFLKPGAIITDIGSTKTDIHKAVERLGYEDVFVGGHPMAGSEKTGYEHSESAFFRDKYYILTPFAESRPEYVAWMEQFIHDIGSHCILLDPDYHDAVVAGISHGPHVISAALVNAVAALDEDGTYGTLAAGGFHTTTRISSSSPEMWQNICLTNSDKICSFLDKYIETLTAAKQQIADGDKDGLMHFFEAAKNYRDHIRF